MHRSHRALRTFFVFFVLLSALTASAQSTIVRGTLLDSLTRESEPYATIRVYKQADKKQAVAMSVTDDDGRFAQTVKGKGTFTVVFSSVGKAALSRNIVLNGEPEVDMGTLLMNGGFPEEGQVCTTTPRCWPTWRWWRRCRW